MFRSFAETLGSCGRDATLFLLVVAALALAAGAGGEPGLWATITVLASGVIRAVWLVAREQARRWDYAHLPPLSQNEQRTVRTKLQSPPAWTDRRMLSRSGQIEYRDPERERRRSQSSTSKTVGIRMRARSQRAAAVSPAEGSRGFVGETPAARSRWEESGLPLRQTTW